MNYFELNGCSGKQHFICEKLNATLSTFACSSRWKTANGKSPPESYAACRGCQLGAEHAGVKMKSHSRWYGKPICNRCHQPSPRLINGEHCPSCYNRGREFEIGLNAKGTPPVKIIKMGGLAKRALRFIVDGAPEFKTTRPILDTTEAVMGVLKSTEGQIAFAFSGAGPFLPEEVN